MKMKTMKRVLLVALALTMLVFAFSACGSKKVSADYNAHAAEYKAQGYLSYIIRENVEKGDGKLRENFVIAYLNNDLDGAKNVFLGMVNSETNAYELSDSAKATITQAATGMTFELADGQVADSNTVTVVGLMSEIQETIPQKNTGVFDVILGGVGWLLKQITRITFNNYVLALFLFAIIVEIVLIFFAILQQKNSIKQAKLAPKERAIRKKYAGRNDQATQQKLQQEIQKLYQDEGFNPMSGCLPMLVQMPVVIALYRIVMDPLQYVFGYSAKLSEALSTYAAASPAAGGLGLEMTAARGNTIQLLSSLNAEQLENFKNFAYYSNAADFDLSGVANLNFNVFGINTGLIPSFKEFSWLLIVPVLTFVAYFFSMKVARKLSYQPAAQDAQTGCSNTMMDVTMPLMSVFITFVTPAAIGIYWIFKCLIGMLQKVILNKIMPLPKFSEEDYKKAERELKGKMRPEDRDPIEVPVKQKKSLHYIDEEDDLPPRERDRSHGDEEEEDTPAERRLKEAARAEEERRAQKANLEAAPLKKDRKNDKKK